MFYEFAITAPANTSSSAPLDTLVSLAAGVITWWEIQFPSGCVGLVHAKVLYSIHQIVPANEDGNVSANGMAVNTLDSIPLDTEPYELTLRLWNDDDTYDHTITFRFAVLSEAERIARDRAYRALAYLDRWFSQSAGSGVQS